MFGETLEDIPDQNSHFQNYAQNERRITESDVIQPKFNLFLSRTPAKAIKLIQNALGEYFTRFECSFGFTPFECSFGFTRFECSFGFTRF